MKQMPMYEQRAIDVVRSGSDNVWQYLENNPGAVTMATAILFGMVLMCVLGLIIYFKFGRKS